MINVAITLINRLEALSGLKVETMERIAQRDGLGEDLEKLIMIDGNIWDTIQQLKTLLEAMGYEPQ